MRTYVEPAVSNARIDAQWAQLTGRLPQSQQRRALFGAGSALARGSMAFAVCAALALAWFNWPDSRSVWEGSVVASDEAPVAVTLAEGTHIQLSPRSQVELLHSSSQSMQLELSAGSARFDVAKHKQRRFSVRSGGVEVLVTGTQFRVSHEPSSRGQRVAVSVEEGSVEVRRPGHEVVVLHAGEQWSTLDDARERSKVALVTPAPTVSSLPARDGLAAEEPDDEPDDAASEQRTAPARKDERARRSATASDAETAEELFEQANVARRAGRLLQAAELFEGLVRAHPRDRHAALSAFELGRIRMDSLGDMRGAVTALERALSLDERRAFSEDALARLALAHDGLGDVKSCARARQRYLARYPEGVHAQYLLGRCAAR